jgi:hypothetical protein
MNSLPFCLDVHSLKVEIYFCKIYRTTDQSTKTGNAFWSNSSGKLQKFGYYFFHEEFYLLR